MKIQSINTINYAPKCNLNNRRYVSFSGNMAVSADKFVKSSKSVQKGGLSSLLTSLSSAIAGNNGAKVSTADVTKLFIQNGFKQNAQGHVFKKLSSVEEKNIEKVYGSAAESIKDFYKPVPKEIQNEFREFLEIGNNYNAAKKDFNKMFVTFSSIYENIANYDKFKNLLKAHPEYNQLIQNAAINTSVNNELLDVVGKYKRLDYISINSGLRGKQPVTPDVKSKINTISSYLDTQVIKNPVILYRGEGFDVLNKIKTKDGASIRLGDLMEKAAKTGDKNQINKIREYILDNNIVAHEAGFMSTSIDKNVSKDFATPLSGEKKMLWILTTKPNTKGGFMEALNVNKSLSNECEVLLQKGSDIKILDAQFKDGLWYLKGEVSNH